MTTLTGVQFGTGGGGVFEIIISLSDGTRSALKCTDTVMALSRYYDGAWNTVWIK